MDDLGGIIAKRIAELEKEREAVVAEANRILAGLNRSIAEFKLLIAPPKEPETTPLVDGQAPEVQ